MSPIQAAAAAPPAMQAFLLWGAAVLISFTPIHMAVRR